METVCKSFGEKIGKMEERRGVAVRGEKKYRPLLLTFHAVRWPVPAQGAKRRVQTPASSLASSAFYQIYPCSLASCTLTMKAALATVTPQLSIISKKFLISKSEFQSRFYP